MGAVRCAWAMQHGIWSECATYRQGCFFTRLGLDSGPCKHLPSGMGNCMDRPFKESMPNTTGRRSSDWFSVQVPTQNFFTDKVGLPLTMNPNFDDLSCEMLFGTSPPPLEEDEAYMQPCFPHVCHLGNTDPRKPCPKIDTSRPQPKR